MNRRNALLIILLALISTLLPVTALARRVGYKRKTDNRLLGTWRSNKELTLKRWRWAKELDASKKEEYENMFGKLEITYTATHIDSEFEGVKSKNRYEVLGSDEYSVAIMIHGKPWNEIRHVIFDSPDQHHVLAGINLEYFTRMNSKDT